MKEHPMLRVLHVVGQLEYGGVATWLRTLVDALAPGTLQVEIACNYRKGPGALTPIFRQLGCRIHHVPLGMNPYTYMAHLRALLASGCYDVVHDHRSVLGGATLKAAHQAGIPVRILFHHTPDDDRHGWGLQRLYERLLKRWALRHASAVWACAEAAMNAHYGKGWVSDCRFRVINSAVLPRQPDTDARARLRREFNIPENAPVIGFVGRVTAPKNPLMAVRAFSAISRIVPEAHLLFVGDGPLLEEARQLAHLEAADVKIRFAGFRADMANIWEALDLLFQPSYFEGLPLTTLEALHAGLPVLGSTAPGLMAVLPADLKTLCRAPDDLEGYVQELSAMLAKTPTRTVPREFLERFSPIAFAEKVVAGYRDGLE